MSIFRPPKPGRSLADRSPDVAAQWHPTRNGELIPAQMSAGTDAKAWWRCEQGHEWEATVDSRTSQGLGCPVCSGRKLLTGYNDLATRFPDIAAQWHPTRNADLVPAQVSKGSGKKVWWRCEEGHEWEAPVDRRTRQSTGCPFCSRRTVIIGYNDLATRFPDVAKQWHSTRNGVLTPNQVNAGTDTEVWWRCEEGHEWEAPVSSRTRQSTGCPVCTGRTVLAGFNDLVTRFPDIAKQWHPTRNADLTPYQVTAGSGKRVWWRCGQGHEWEARVNSRTSRGSGCPVCSRR